jgi:hypothetical protein
VILEAGHGGAGVLDPAAEQSRHGNRTDTQGKDQALQLVRRLDWRFLLPNPVLGDIAYIGSMGGTLPRALQQFSDMLTIVLPSDLSSADVKCGCSYETVVLQSSAVAAVKDVKPLLAPGGYLYWEVERASGIDHVRKYMKAARRMGFDDIQIYWHRPDFETCLEMIPLTNSRALRFAFARRQESTTKRLKFAAGRLLVTTGLLPRVVPCFSIVARKPQSY